MIKLVSQKWKKGTFFILAAQMKKTRIVKVVLFSLQQKESQNPQQNIILNVKDFTKQLIKTNGH